MSDLAITERRDLSLALILVRRGTRSAAAGALRGRLGLDLPAPGRLTSGGGVTLLWHGLDRCLAMRDGAGSTLATELASALSAAGYVVEASASRVVLSVSGAGAGEALSRHLPIDLHPRVFTPGSVALTRAAHIDVLVWRPLDQDSFGLACASSYAASFLRHSPVIHSSVVAMSEATKQSRLR